VSEDTNFLSADWINARFRHVEEWLVESFDRVLFDGFLATGLLPLEEPMTTALLRRMTPEQLDAYLLTLGEEQRSKILDKLEALRPPPELDSAP